MISKKLLLFAITCTIVMGTLGVPNISAYDPAQEPCDNFWIPLAAFIQYNFCEQKICVENDDITNACTRWETP